MTLTIDNKTITRTLLVAFFMKGTYAGGGMRLGPKAGEDKGMMRVSLVPPISPITLLRHTYNLFAKGIQSVDFVDNFPASSINLHSSEPLDLEIDGEIYSCRQFTLQVVPNRLKCLINPLS